MREIMSEARKLTQAERCSLFLLDHKNNELIAKVFDGDIIEGEDDGDDEAADRGDGGGGSKGSRKSSKEVRVRRYV